MRIENYNLYDEIFDSILTQALKEDCAKEAELYMNMPEEHVFNEKFENGIESIKSGLKKKERSIKLKKILPKFATVVAVAIMFAALVANPSVSAFVKNIFVKITGVSNQHEFNNDIEITADNFNYELRPSYLPGGYNIKTVYYSSISMMIEFLDDNDNSIVIQYGSASDAAIGFDNEHSALRYVTVNEKEAIFYETTSEDYPSYLVWQTGGYAFVINAQISLDKFVKIAESIKIQ
jgi:hypothetical protein